MKSTNSQIRNQSTTMTHGFTLLELMVVILTIGMLTALIVPSMVSAVRRGGVQSTAEQILDMIQFAHTTAISRHQRVVLNIDANRARCWISTTAPNLPWTDIPSETKTPPLVSLPLPAGIEIIVRRDPNTSASTASTLTWEAITFNSDGSTDDILVSMIDPTGKRFDIQLFGLTGQVSLKEIAI